MRGTAIMLEIKFSGRGGQGVVLASQMLGRAFFESGWYPQCYSVFGGERRGAPLVSYLRVDKKPIRLKCEIEHPNELVCLDAGLIAGDILADQVRPGGNVLINTRQSLNDFPQVPQLRIGVIDASGIAEKCGLGRMFNTAVLGAYTRFMGHLSFTDICRGIEALLPRKIEANRQAAQRAFETVVFQPGTY